MTKKSVFTILFIMLIITISISLYTTFAYDEEASKLDDSNATYNLIYSIKKSSNRSVTVASNTTKYVDIVLNNTYEGTIKYGMYYKLLNQNKLPENVTISLAPGSSSKLQGTIDSEDSKTISIKIENYSNYNLEFVIGALVGFENGNIGELIKEGETLIK